MMDGRNDASSVSQSQGTLSPRELDQDSLTETESSVHLPNQKKLPSLDELDKNFVELDRVPDGTWFSVIFVKIYKYIISLC